jgi:hypothetical protein
MRSRTDHFDRRCDEALHEGLARLDRWHEEYVTDWKQRLHAAVHRECDALRRGTAKA